MCLGFELGGIANRGITKNCMYVCWFLVCIFIFFVFCQISLIPVTMPLAVQVDYPVVKSH